MQEHYFTPEIEDIHIGYEAEFNLAGFGKEGWQYVKFKGVDKAVRCYHEKGLYRVPYLTKEQIEAEGWKPRDCIVYTDWVKNGYELFHANKENKIRIISNGIQLFYGECRDINTFRQIQKLLEI